VLGILASTWRAFRATTAEREQTRLRDRAEALAKEASAQERTTRLRAYASEVSVALQAWETGNPSKARLLLENQRPKRGEERRTCVASSGVTCMACFNLVRSRLCICKAE
jgi:hypothetical protein